MTITLRTGLGRSLSHAEMDGNFSHLAGFDATTYGVVADGTTDDTAALQAAIDAASTAGGGVVLLPPETIALGTPVRLKSGVTLRGSPGATVIRPLASFSATGNVITNITYSGYTDRTTRTDYDLGAENIIFDGSLRPTVAYPTAGYTNQGSMVLFIRCKRPFVRGCTFKDYAAGWGINGQGNLNARFVDNQFVNMGKGDIDTGGIIDNNYGNFRNTMTAITKANPGAVSTGYPHGLSSGVHYLSGVRGMTELTDGEYTITVTGTSGFTIGVNTSAYTTFVFDADCEISERYGMRAEGTVITGNQFDSINRMAISCGGDGSIISNNSVKGAGEAGIYVLYGKNCIVEGNKVSDVEMTDIVGSCIEVNYGANHIIRNNQLYRPDCNGIRVAGMIGGSISGNIVKNCGYTSGLEYPVGPGAVAAGFSGAIDDSLRAAIFITNYIDCPTQGILVTGNDIRDTRPTPLTTYGIRVGKYTSDNKNFGLQITGNRFDGLTALSESLWVSSASAATARGCWVEYFHPTTGNRVVRELSGTGSGVLPYCVSAGPRVSGAADTNENTLATVTIPANSMGPNGSVEVDLLLTVTNSGNNKTVRVKFGGTTYLAGVFTTSAQLALQCRITNAGTTNSQVGIGGNFVGYSGTTAAVVTSAVDTTSDVTLLITGQKATGAEALTLESYSVKVFR